MKINVRYTLLNILSDIQKLDESIKSRFIYFIAVLKKLNKMFRYNIIRN